MKDVVDTLVEEKKELKSKVNSRQPLRQIILLFYGKNPTAYASLEHPLQREWPGQYFYPIKKKGKKLKLSTKKGFIQGERCINFYSDLNNYFFHFFEHD
jgi:hypothetical protein